MRKYLIALLMLISCSAWAEWLLLSETTWSKVYVDLDTIKKDGNISSVWAVNDFYSRNKDGELSSRNRVHIDCKNERYRATSFSSHSENMAGGRVLYSDPISNPQWTDIAPNTVVRSFANILCANQAIKK
jgi:hypothetical protein